MIKLPRRAFLHMARGAAALPVVSQIVMAENQSTPSRSEPRQRPLAERLAAYAHDLRYDDLDAATVERVKVHVIDTIGCGIGAFQERAVHICRDLALAVAGNATIVGTQRRTTPDLASFANGAAFRYLDFNDTYVGRIAVHPSDQIAACLAVAEAERASIQDLITAIAVAYEVNCRLVDSLDAANRGWDPPVFSLSRGGARGRQADEARSRAADPGGQPRHQRPHSDGANPGADAVGLERAGRRRSRAQCGVCGAAGARRPDRSGAHI